MYGGNFGQNFSKKFLRGSENPTLSLGLFFNGGEGIGVFFNGGGTEGSNFSGGKLLKNFHRRGTNPQNFPPAAG